MGTTLKDIAERAGVSSATVSMALNNKKGVSHEKARLIRQIAEELGYLKVAEFDVSGNVVHFIQILKPTQTWDDIYKIFIVDYLEGLTTEASKFGVTIEMGTYETGDMQSICDSLNTFNVLGTVFLGAGLYPEDIAILRGIQSPAVFIDVCYPGLGVDFVDMDNQECVYEILQYLRSIGHEHVGIVQGEEKTPNFTSREQAFFSALREFDFKWNDAYYFKINKDQDVGKGQMIELLQERDELPSSLFCVNDMIAYNCIHACQELGIDIPDSMAIVGFDDLPASKIIRPSLTTMNIPTRMIAKKALRILLERGRLSTEKPAEKVLISGWLIKRESA